MTKEKQNYSKAHKKYLRGLKTKSFLTHLTRILLLILLLSIWEISAAFNLVDPFITSSPSRIFNQIVAMLKDGTLVYHSWVTLYETLLAFFISTALGGLIALLLYVLPFVRRVLEPYLIVLNSLPKIALGPLIIVWIGTGTKSIVVMGILICIVITIISMLNGYLSVPKEKILLLKTMGASKFQILTRLIIPASLKDFISVLKINVGMSWVGVVMGEYLTSKAGLGYLIVYGGQVFKLDLVMASTILLCVLASLMYLVVAFSLQYWDICCFLAWVGS